MSYLARSGRGGSCSSPHRALEQREAVKALSFIVDFHRDDTVLEFLEVRRILELAATALAALHMSDEDKAQLREGTYSAPST